MKKQKWAGIIGFENIATGDGRFIEEGALNWATLPMPIRVTMEDVGAHDGAVVAGQITAIKRLATQENGAIPIWAEGVFDMGGKYGVEAARLVTEGMMNGVSMDLDDSAFEIRPAALSGGGTTDDDMMVTASARVRAATIVAIPAFEGARIYTTKREAPAVVASGAEKFAYNQDQWRAPKGAKSATGESAGGRWIDMPHTALRRLGEISASSNPEVADSIHAAANEIDGLLQQGDGDTALVEEVQDRTSDVLEKNRYELEALIDGENDVEETINDLEIFINTDANLIAAALSTPQDEVDTGDMEDYDDDEDDEDDVPEIDPKQLELASDQLPEEYAEMLDAGELQWERDDSSGDYELVNVMNGNLYATLERDGLELTINDDYIEDSVLRSELNGLNIKEEDLPYVGDLLTQYEAARDRGDEQGQQAAIDDLADSGVLDYVSSDSEKKLRELFGYPDSDGLSPDEQDAAYEDSLVLSDGVLEQLQKAEGMEPNPEYEGDWEDDLFGIRQSLEIGDIEDAIEAAWTMGLDDLATELERNFPNSESDEASGDSFEHNGETVKQDGGKYFIEDAPRTIEGPYDSAEEAKAAIDDWRGPSEYANTVTDEDEEFSLAEAIDLATELNRPYRGSLRSGTAAAHAFNWVEETGGLPNYIRDIADALMTRNGWNESRAIATAVNTVKRWARKGKVTPGGKHNVSAKTAAKAAKAVAEWETKRARAKATATEGVETLTVHEPVQVDRNLVASGGKLAAPVAPPKAWFDNPNLSGPTPLQVTNDGRIYGHLAKWDVCHLAQPNGATECVAAPRSYSNYSLFHLGAVRTAEGVDVPTGRITMNTGHANIRLNTKPTIEHYDNTGFAVADVAAGEDAYGIWVAGALRPEVTESQVRALRASPLSGDWRRQNDGSLELVMALAVNMPGFPVPRPAGLVASGAVTSLVAAGMLVPEKVSTQKARLAKADPTGVDADDIRYLRKLAAKERMIEAEELKMRLDAVVSAPKIHALAAKLGMI